MSCASCGSLKPPEISAPVRPSIPFGFSWKLMIGRVTASSSRTTAKWPENAAAVSESTAPSAPCVAACSAPRRAMSCVTSWNASRPLSVKSNWTTGWLNWSKACWGSSIWSPVSA